MNTRTNRGTTADRIGDGTNVEHSSRGVRSRKEHQKKGFERHSEVSNEIQTEKLLLSVTEAGRKRGQNIVYTAGCGQTSVERAKYSRKT